MAAFHRKLTRNDRISTRVEPNGEALFFVWRGAIRVSDGKNVYKAGERDTVFISGKARLTVTGDADGVTEVVQVQAPPLAGK